MILFIKAYIYIHIKLDTSINYIAHFYTGLNKNSNVGIKFCITN